MRVNKKEKGIQQGIPYKRESKRIPRKTLKGDPRTTLVNRQKYQAELELTRRSLERLPQEEEIKRCANQ